VDDFLVVAEAAAARVALVYVQELLADVGLPVAPEKTAGPAEAVAWIGYDIDVAENRVEVRAEIQAEIREELRRLVGRGGRGFSEQRWRRLKGKVAWLVELRPELRLMAAPFIWESYEGMERPGTLKMRAEALAEVVDQHRAWCPVRERRRKAVDVFTDACG